MGRVPVDLSRSAAQVRQPHAARRRWNIYENTATVTMLVVETSALLRVTTYVRLQFLPSTERKNLLWSLPKALAASQLTSPASRSNTGETTKRETLPEGRCRVRMSNLWVDGEVRLIGLHAALPHP